MIRKSLALLLAGLMFLAGCAPAITNSLEAGKTFPLATTQALAFGKIVFVENDREKVPYPWWGTIPTLTLFRVETEEYISAAVEKDGDFYWLLPRGTYILAEIRYGYKLCPRVAFQVPLEGDAFYLGTLRVSVDTGLIINQLKTITVQDDFETEKKALDERNPALSAVTEKKLMIHNPSLPVDRRYFHARDLAQALMIIGITLMQQLYLIH